MAPVTLVLCLDLGRCIGGLSSYEKCTITESWECDGLFLPVEKPRLIFKYSGTIHYPWKALPKGDGSDWSRPRQVGWEHSRDLSRHVHFPDVLRVKTMSGSQFPRLNATFVAWVCLEAPTISSSWTWICRWTSAIWNSTSPAQGRHREGRSEGGRDRGRRERKRQSEGERGKRKSIDEHPRPCESVHNKACRHRTTRRTSNQQQWWRGEDWEGWDHRAEHWSWHRQTEQQ